MGIIIVALKLEVLSWCRQLDGDLQNHFLKFLKARGIDNSLSNYLLGQLEDKYRREYTDWLENLASFIKKWEVCSFSHSYLWKTFEQWHCAGSRHILEFFLISLSLSGSWNWQMCCSSLQNELINASWIENLQDFSAQWGCFHAWKGPC